MYRYNYGRCGSERIDMNNFDCKTFDYLVPTEEAHIMCVNKPRAYNFYKTNDFVKYSYIKTTESELDLRKEKRIELEKQECRILSIIYNVDKNSFDVYIDKIIKVIKIDEELENQFLEKVKLYNDRIERLRKDFEEKQICEFQDEKTKEIELSLFQRIKNYFKK